MQYLNYLFLLQLVCHEGSNGISCPFFPIFLEFWQAKSKSKDETNVYKKGKESTL